MIIGNTFLTEFRAVLNYYTSNCTLGRHGKTYTLRPLSYSGANFDSPYCAHTIRTPVSPSAASARVPVENLLLNAAQCNRAIRQGCESFLVMVNTAVTPSGTADVTSISYDSASAAPLDLPEGSASASSAAIFFFFFFRLQDSCPFLSSRRAFRTPDEPEVRRNNGLMCLQQVLHSLYLSTLTLSSLNLPMCLLSHLDYLQTEVLSMSFLWNLMHSLPSNACIAYHLLSSSKSNGK